MTDISDLVTRLRQPLPEFVCDNPCYTPRANTERREAADDIDQLHSTLRQLRRAATLHTFMPRGHETTSDRETCAVCGGNFRNTEKHVTAKEGHPKSVLADAIREADALLAALKDKVADPGRPVPKHASGP